MILKPGKQFFKTANTVQISKNETLKGGPPSLLSCLACRRRNLLREALDITMEPFS